MRGLFTLIFARLVFAREYANEPRPLTLPTEHPFAKHFQDLVTSGYSPNLSRRPPLVKWQKRIEKVFLQKEEIYNSDIVPLLFKGELKTPVRLFLKIIDKTYVEGLRNLLSIFRPPVEPQINLMKYIGEWIGKIALLKPIVA